MTGLRQEGRAPDVGTAGALRAEPGTPGKTHRRGLLSEMGSECSQAFTPGRA